MRTVQLLVVSCFFAACGKDSSKSHSPVPTTENQPAPSTEPGLTSNDRAQREADVVRQYKAIGVEFKFWDGQTAEARDVEIEQLLQLLPEIKKRVSAVKFLEVSGYKMHWYRPASKALKIELTSGVDAAVQYLTVFDKVRDLEKKLNGPLIERASETTELLEGDLRFYDKINLAALMQNRPYIKAVHPSGSMQYIKGAGVFYIKADATAEQLKERLDGLDRWYRLSKELGIEIEDNTQYYYSGTFISAVDALQSKVALIKPVADLITKIEINLHTTEMSFNLSTGIFKLSTYDAAHSDNLWLALVDYKKVVATLKIPIQIPDYTQNNEDMLRDGFKLLIDNLDLVQSKLGSIKGILVSASGESKLSNGKVLWVGSQQASAEFSAYVESL